MHSNFNPVARITFCVTCPLREEKPGTRQHTSQTKNKDTDSAFRNSCLTAEEFDMQRACIIDPLQPVTIHVQYSLIITERKSTKRWTINFITYPDNQKDFQV